MSSQQGFFSSYAAQNRPTGATSAATGAQSTSSYGRPQPAAVPQSYTIPQTTQAQTSGLSQAGLQQASSGYAIEGRDAQLTGDMTGYLKWASELTNDTVISGSSDYAQLSNLKNAMIELKSSYFNPNSGLSVKGAEGDELSIRFLHIEHEIEGLLRRRIDYTTKDHLTGERTIDYTSLVNEKETQVVELEKKIQNLEERLKRSNAREIELENKIVALKAETLSLKGVTGKKLDDAVKREQEYDRAQLDLKTLQETFATTAGIWQQQLNGYKLKYPTDNKFELDSSVTQKLTSGNIKPITVGDFSFLEVQSNRTVEVPVQDTRTKRLIHLLTSNFKTIFEKYPKLKTEMNLELQEFFNQELIDIIEVDELDRLVEIVKFVPQSVRVENVYAYSSAKTRRVEFHLRVLLKALLEECEALKVKHGAVLSLDEGVVGMINQEIMGVVNVDDILKVFRVVPKIVEVERIVEKVVERIV